MKIDDRTAAVIGKLTDRTKAGAVGWHTVRFEDGRHGVADQAFSTTLRAPSGTGLQWTVVRFSPGGSPDWMRVRVDRRELRPGGERESAEVFAADAENGAVGEQAQFDLLEELHEAAHRSAVGWEDVLGEAEAALAAA